MSKTGLEVLLTPENSILVLIDHQPYQFANLHSHEPTMIVNNVVGLAKAARVFSVPTILTTVIEERGGHIINVNPVDRRSKPAQKTEQCVAGGAECPPATRFRLGCCLGGEPLDQELRGRG